MHKILLVDDSADILDVLKMFLEMKQYRVRTLSGASFIHEVLSEFKPDLIILDIFLREQDGRDVCKSLRQNPEIKDLPILLTSASPATLAEYKTYLADDYLEKPFDLSTLDQKIQSLLARTR